MDDALLVGVVQRPADVDGHLEGVRQSSMPATPMRSITCVRFSPAMYSIATQQYGRRSCRRRTGVTRLGCCSGSMVFMAADEALHLLLVLGELRQQHLEGDGPVVLGVGGVEDHADVARPMTGPMS